MRKTALSLLAVFLLYAAGPVTRAAEPAPANDFVRFQTTSTQLIWQQLRAANGFRVIVTDPDGRLRASFDFKSDPSVDLNELADALGGLEDGCYSWDVYSRLPLDGKTVAQLQALRDAGEPMPVDIVRALKDSHQAGTFWVVGGTFVYDAKAEETPNKAVAQTAPALLDGVTVGVPGVVDHAVIPEDLCVGFDCPNSYFGPDTILLRENNNRILFDDSSTFQSFPRGDWKLEANSRFNGGGDYFRIIDVTGNREIFTVEAGAPSHSLVVDGAGRVGLGTANPVKHLQVTDGNTPTLRLDQTGASGFREQAWDVGGNEANFFISDRTNGLTLPFRIYPGAATDSLFITGDGEIGIGPQGLLGSNVDAKVDINGVDVGTNALSMDFGNSQTEVTWFFQNDQDESFKISREGTGGAEMVLRDRGDARGPTLTVDGSIQATNVSFSSSRALKTAFNTVDPVDVLERLAGIPILEWRYKTEDEGTKHLGPIAEEFMEAFELGRDERRISITDINGVALAAIQGLHQENRELREDNDALRRSQEELTARLEALEALLSER